MSLHCQGSGTASQDHMLPADQSQLACTACRRKKTKCDRSIPSCNICTRLQDNCIYPTRRLKPGPKARQHQADVLNTHQWSANRVYVAPDHAPTSGKFSRIPSKRSLSRGSDVENTSISRHRTGPAEPTVVNELGGDYDSESSDIPPDSLGIESNFVKAIGLSSMIHPTHDKCAIYPPSPDSTTMPGPLLNLTAAQSLLTDACEVFGLSLQEFQYRIDLYFDTMTEFSLFHRPSFPQKIQNIRNSIHRQALFAAMLAYSAGFYPESSFSQTLSPHNPSCAPDAARFHQQALQLIEKSLNETHDPSPSLCLLQAMVLVTFCELTKGVRGRAWRLLGSCVRLAYELHLHLIDYEGRQEYFKIGRDLSLWISDEERRRCWWAIWKMDTFASVIRRLPVGIDWTMVDTYLPVPDELWFSNHYSQSCFLERDPVARVKALKRCGNESPHSWTIVITSIMRDAQVLHKGNLHGILIEMDSERSCDQLLHYYRNHFRRKKSPEDSLRLRSLVCALNSATAELPECLAYGKEPLNFGTSFGSEIDDLQARRVHCAKYNIYLSLKHAQFMIYHLYAFSEIVSGTIFCAEQNILDQGSLSPGRNSPQNARGLKYCLQASDDICVCLSQCPASHVKYVSPFHASTVWLAASLQVLRKQFGRTEDLQESVSRYRILRKTCENFFTFWATPSALLENLDSLEARLSQFSQCTNSSTRKPASTRKFMCSPTISEGIDTHQCGAKKHNPIVVEEGQCQPSVHEGTSPSHQSELPVPFMESDYYDSGNVPFAYSPPITHWGADQYIPDQGLSDRQSLFPSSGETQGLEGGNLDLENWFSLYLSEMFSETYEIGSWSRAPAGG